MESYHLIDWAVASSVAYLKPWADRRIVIETCLGTMVRAHRLTVEQAGAARRALLLIAAASTAPSVSALRRQA